MNITSLLDRVIAVLRRKHIEDELDEEIREHIEMATEENLRRGISLDEARYAARRSFGGIEQMKENHREGRGLPATCSIRRARPKPCIGPIALSVFKISRSSVP